ncbi:MAG: SH3 domain-containing protein [Chitinophagales bacterium]
MSKKNWVLTALSVALLLGGFWAGHYVNAQVLGQPDTGSSQDPLVTQSYVDSRLKAQNDSLQAQITALQNRIALLESKSGSGGPSTGTSSTPPSTTTTAAKKVYPKAGSNWINIRSGPGTSYSVVAKLYPNKPATLVSQRNNWYLVKMSDGKAGWVSMDVSIAK